MSTTASSIDTATRTGNSWLARFDEWSERIGDRLNPILVKETRQALKSRQFFFTFVLVLVACWAWTFMGLAMIGPTAFHTAEAAEMFQGYYVILAFPLAIIIPFSAYRSLAAEREDNTYELLSITNLSARQIVFGKLGSAVLQMMVYLSAVAPCLAFTYLLRGIDILTIGYVLYYAFFGSLGLSAIALFLGTISKTRFGQVVVSVAIVLGLAYAFGLSIVFTSEILRVSRYMLDDEFWIINGIIATIYVTYFALIVFAAAAQLTFESENRSTPLRWVMFIQHGCIAAWVAYFAVFMEQAVVVGFGVIMMAYLGVHWYVMGAMMTSERAQLSPRTARRLPQSHLGRAFFTWFNPGPGTGYVFVIANLLAGMVFAAICMLLGEMFSWNNMPWGGPDVLVTCCYMVVLLGYVSLFLGLGCMLVRLIRTFVVLPMVGAVAVHAILIAVATAVPLFLQMMSPELRHGGYSLLQITNPFWSLVEVLDNHNDLSTEAWVLLVVIPIAGLLVLWLNRRMILAGIGQGRTEKPARVLEEDQAIEAAQRPRPTSPWDEDPAKVDGDQ